MFERAAGTPKNVGVLFSSELRLVSTARALLEEQCIYMYEQVLPLTTSYSCAILIMSQLI
jgi:hypothetical protein